MNSLLALSLLVSQANAVLEPKQPNEVGYTVEYRQDRDYVWINVTKVKRICGPETVVRVKQGAIFKSAQTRCRLRGFIESDSLFQIHCEGKGCPAKLAANVTVPAIQQLIIEGITDTLVDSP